MNYMEHGGIFGEWLPFVKRSWIWWTFNNYVLCTSLTYWSTVFTIICWCCFPVFPVCNLQCKMLSIETQLLSRICIKYTVAILLPSHLPCPCAGFWEEYQTAYANMFPTLSTTMGYKTCLCILYYTDDCGNWMVCV